ncbi:MAG: murein L,D-transpeptidase catalytic domain family protein [Gammaproteobacteria bacterium]
MNKEDSMQAFIQRVAKSWLTGFLLSAVFATSAVAEGLQVNLNPNKLERKAKNLNPVVLSIALDAYRDALKDGHVTKPYLAIIDFSKPSNQRRMWIFDLQRQQKLYELHVTHGLNTGNNMQAFQFSNRVGSLQSSLGVFVTKNLYDGRQGYSLRLEGLEPGINDNAMRRGIVIHGADYASRDYLQKTGRLGRSWGCPAIDDELNAEVIELLENGSVVFAFYPDRQWLVSAEYAGPPSPFEDA